MLHRTVNQFLSDVYFGDIDVLVCDLPPGTGDVALFAALFGVVALLAWQSSSFLRGRIGARRRRERRSERFASVVMCSSSISAKLRNSSCKVWSPASLAARV